MIEETTTTTTTTAIKLCLVNINMRVAINFSFQGKSQGRVSPKFEYFYAYQVSSISAQWFFFSFYVQKYTDTQTDALKQYLLSQFCSAMDYYAALPPPKENVVTD